ncbi:DUF5361 domain-containing protein [Streptomyces sp. NPDC006339]|uniref:DUF5361 domain-containing protein n=1 Tax=Streptomyces sp. NPDC006339 TaxID=3156755 RepID=UPI0033BE381A
MGRARRGRGKSGAAILASPLHAEALALDLTLRGADPELGHYTVGRIGALWAVLAHDPRSTVARVGGSDGHTASEHLLFLSLDELRVANWLKSKDGAKGRNRPKPVSPLARKPGLRTGRTDRSPAEVMALLRRHRTP